MLLAEPSTDRVIGLHRHTGPGLLESVYEQCLCHELGEAAIVFAQRVTIPTVYKGAPVGSGFKVDIVVAHGLSWRLNPSQPSSRSMRCNSVLNLRTNGIHVGLLLNSNIPRLADGLRRYVV
jgi:GxxExxY protein